jgi:hypothetical protein
VKFEEKWKIMKKKNSMTKEGGERADDRTKEKKGR